MEGLPRSAATFRGEDGELAATLRLSREFAVPALAPREARRAALRFGPPRRQRQLHLALDGGGLIAVEAFIGRLPVGGHGDRRKARDLGGELLGRGAGGAARHL